MAADNLSHGLLQPRSTSIAYSGIFNAWRSNTQRVNFIIENNLDQSISVQIQGQARFGKIWFNLGDPFTITAGQGDFMEIDQNWGQFRAAITPAVSPTSGDVGVFVETGFAGAVI